ncbi:myosin-9-like [Penaeus indicus]|uniref:myosin-9-like n=1 Tax=Penaeus indicus TaxID=29960 RepID=UPI00300C3BD3
MDGDDSITEDEWTSMKRRFSLEGLEWETQDQNMKTLQVWRLLVDAEANLKAVRHINDKLRRQHDQEKEELEEYTEHLRQKCEERVKELDNEVKTLKEDLEALLAGTQAVGTMLLNEGLEDVAQSTLGEQIAYLLVERAKLNEELIAARTKPASDREKELTTQLIKVSTDYELLKRTQQESEEKLAEMTDRVSLLEKASRQLELNNESLAYKLSEALAEIEENENQLRLYSKNSNFKRGESPRVSLRSQEDYGPPSLRSLPISENSFIRRDSQRRSGRKGESPRSSNRQRKHESARGERSKSAGRSLSRQRRVSRSGSLRLEEGEAGERRLSDAVEAGLLSGDRSFDINDVRRSSVMSSSASSPRKLHSLLDTQIQTAKSQINMLDEVKQLQEANVLTCHSESARGERSKSAGRSLSRQRRVSRSGSLRLDEGEAGERRLSDAVEAGLLSGDRSFDINDARRSSVMSSSASSPRKLHSLLDTQIQTAKSQINMLDEVKQLQAELETMKKDLLGAGDKYEFIVRKYELYKIKSKSKVYSIKSTYQTELEGLQRQNNSLEAQVALQRDQLRSDDALRKELESDLASVRTERQEMAVRVREIERELQKRDQEIGLLQEKVKLLQERNQQLNEKLQEMSLAAIVG